MPRHLKKLQQKTKRPGTVYHFKISFIAAALTMVLSYPAASFANEDSTSFIVSTRSPESTEKESARRLQSVSLFAQKTYQTMQTPTSKRYLNDLRFSSISTFPMRLLERLEGNEWQPAPFLPVPEKDLGCYYGIPSYRTPVEYDINTTPVTISADSVYGSIDGQAVYEGNVIMSQGDRSIRSSKASYDRNTSVVTVQGSSVYQAPEYTLTTEEPIESNLEDKITNLGQTEYQLNGSPARGSAGTLTINSQKESSRVTDFVFTTCPTGNESWRVEAAEVELIKGEAFGEAYDAKVYIGDIPVFWTPYINFPISNERKSGLLYPQISYGSTNGFDYAQPIYLNLAPNFDDTITPRIMTSRGVLLSNEFRYMLNENSEGHLITDYIYHDSNWDLDGKDDKQRWMIDWYHRATFFNSDLLVEVDYKKVRQGDYDYISDFGITGATITENNLMQSLKALWDKETYDISLEVREYQSLVPSEASIIRPFAMMPKLKGSWYDTFGRLKTGFSGELVQFTEPSDGDYDNFAATRLHLEPSIEYQFVNSRGTLLAAGARGFFTHYDQDDLEKLPDYYQTNLGFREFNSNEDRALYLLELRGKTTLERKILDMRHTQTLEPEIAYHYIPYKDQSRIGLYDTTDRMTDYYSNFSWRRFTGNDRIADTNAVTFGLTSRILDPHDREKLRLVISQTYSFVRTRVTLNPNDAPTENPRSPLAFTFDFSPIDEITSHGQIAYDNETNRISSGNFMTEYADENGYMVQVNYRFSRDGNRTLENRVVDLDQIGLQFKVPLFSDRLSLIAAGYRDLEQHRDINTKLALRYEECCYAIAFVFEDYNRTDWDNMTSKNENRFGIQFEFKGLGAVTVTGSDEVDTTDTYLIDHFNPTNLNR